MVQSIIGEISIWEQSGREIFTGSITDNVLIGTKQNTGGEKLFVVGNTKIEGDVEITGTLIGTVNANTINITDTDTDSTFYLTFVDDNGNTKTLFCDKATTPLSYNPSTNTLNISKLSNSSTIELTGGSKKFTINESNRFEYESNSNVRISLFETSGNLDEKYTEISNNGGSFTITNITDNRSNNFTPMILDRKLNSNLTANIFFGCETEFIIRDTLNNNKFVFDIATSNLTCSNLVGNADTATQLQTARTINGVLFNGTSDIQTINGGTNISVSTNTINLDSALSSLTSISNGNNKLSFNVSNRYELENIGNVRLSFYSTNSNTDQKYFEVVNNGGSFQISNITDNRSSNFVPLLLDRKVNSNLTSNVFFSCETEFIIRDTGFNNKFVFDISTSNLTCSNFTGNLVGTASNSSAINISDTDINSTFYLTFVDDSGNTKTLFCDKATTPLSYNPSTNTLTCSNINTTTFKIENSDTRILLKDISAGTDMKNLDIVNNNGGLAIANFNDARDASSVIFQLNRKSTSTECDEIFISCTDFVKIRDFSGPTDKFSFTMSSGDLTCTTVTANVNATTIDSTNLEITNIKAKDGTACGSIANSTGVITLASSVLTTTDINAGTIDNCNITVGSGKTLNVSAGTLTLADNQISGDKVEGGTINAITINTLSATTLLGSGGASINLQTAHFSADFFSTTPEATANSILFTRTTSVNGRKIILGSNITYDSSTNILSHTGDINIATGKNYKINGTQIASSNLSNDSSLQKISSNTFGNFINIGNLDIGTWNHNTDFSMFKNSSVTGSGDYALLQQNTGATFLNSSAGQVLNLGIGNSYKLVIGTGGDVTLSNNLILSTGQINFPYFQISGTSANFMGALGFNRNVATGAILNTSFKAYQLHNNDGKLYLQGFNTDTSAFSGDIFIVDGENIGIGISSPTAMLHIDAGLTSIPVSGFIRIGSTDYSSQTNNIMLSVAPGVVSFDANGVVGGRFKMDSAGNVGIGNSAPSTKLQVNGTVKASAFDPPSDDRLKKNEQALGNIGLEVINKLVCEKYDKVKEIIYLPIHDETDYVDNNDNTGNPVDNSDEIKMSFAHKTQIDWNLDNYSDNHFMKEVGFIAQKVEQIDELKDYVDIGNDNEPYTLDYNSIFTFAVKAIQELSDENTQLKNRITTLENKISDLENENLSQNQYIDILESKISDLENNLNLIMKHLNLN